jgi:RNase P/RNase MRP subunit POP5
VIDDYFILFGVKHKQANLFVFFFKVGAAIRVDILKYNASTRRAILKCPSDDFVKVRSALITVTEFSKAECYFKVHRVAASLLSLTASSRTFKF